jgi:hypothetical protein
MDVDFASYFDLSSPALRGSVLGGLVSWGMGGGIDKFKRDWKEGTASLASRVVVSGLIGLPLELLIEMSGVDILLQYKMWVLAVAVYFGVQFTATLETSWITGPIHRVLSMLPF